jgi:hypothetical protein
MRLALALLLLAGCQDYLFEPVCPQTIEESQITGTPADPTPADILFIVDNSGSMADDQRRIAASFDAFIDQLSAVQNASYRIGVVTTDLDSAQGERAGEVTYQWLDQAPYEIRTSNANRPGEPGVCSEVGIAHGCLRGPPITSELSASEQDMLFNSTVTVGSCGSGKEQGLAAAIEALRKTRNDCNTDFLRPNANLVLIFVTDEQDASPDDVADYVNQLAEFKPWSDIRAAGIFGSVGGNASSCSAIGGLPSASCGSQCDACPGASWCGDVDPNLFAADGGQGCGFCSYYNAPDCCSAVAGSRYQSFLAEVDARVKAADPEIETATLVDSICQDDFSATLKRIASEIIFDPCYPLAEQPVNPDGIAASVQGGRNLQKGSEFEVRTKMDGTYEVCLTSADVLGPGEELEISYVTKFESRPSIHPACN